MHFSWGSGIIEKAVRKKNWIWENVLFLGPLWYDQLPANEKDKICHSKHDSQANLAINQ